MITNFSLTQQDTNVNPNTGIRYGVINGNNLPDWIWDSIEYRYPSPWDYSYCEICKCGHELEINQQTAWGDELECPICGDTNELQMPDMEATELYIDTPDLQLSYDPNSNIAMIFKSNLIINCQLCSPCYPNAGNLDQIDIDGYETYGIPE